MHTTFSPFTVTYAQIESDVGEFKHECMLAAQLAVSKNVNSLPIAVMMSGGIDSELVAESLRIANIPFTAIIGRLMTTVGEIDNVFNVHDYQFAERWCSRNNVPVMYCDIDIYKFSGLLSDYALSASGFSPQYACHMYIMKWCADQGFFFLAGNGEMDIVLHNGHYCMLDEQREFTLGNFVDANKLSGVWQFWKQHSRITAAFLKLPSVKKLMDKKVTQILDYKYECFADVFSFEPRKKQTGFEEIQQWDSHLRNPMKSKMGAYDEKWYTPIGVFTNVLG